MLISNHTYQTPESKRRQKTQEIGNILRNVPYEKAFHFYTAIGSFTGETATSLEEFEKKLQLVPAESISFHVRRGDFQKWIEDTLGDNELAQRIATTRTGLSTETLRTDLRAIVRTRITELRQQLPHGLRHAHA